MQLEESTFADRLQRVHGLLDMWRIDALLILNMKNIRYLTGFSGSDGALCIGHDFAVLLVDGRYITQAREETSGMEICRYLNKLDALAEVLLQCECRVVGFEAETMTVATRSDLQERMPLMAFQSLRQELESLRSVKDRLEIQNIRQAADIASRALSDVLERVRLGLTELNIAAYLDFAMRQYGAEDVSFPTIVAFGDHSALPHARPQNREIRAGDFITIDFGAVFKGYHSDETCTVVFGRADDRQEQVYSIVREAHDRALKAIRAGVSCSEIDAVSRGWIEEQGFGQYFTHGTGHGVGLDVHEYPRLAAQSETVLEAGMVVTVEPGIYLPGHWGVRIEDLVAVKEDGCEILSKYPKEFNVIEIK